MKAIALLSGGLDSTVAAWLAAQQMSIELALTMDYGQRAAPAEIAAAARVAAALGIPHRVIALPWIKQIIHSALTDFSCSLPHLQPEELDAPAAAHAAAAVWIPNRNGLFINIAGVFAEALSCEGIVVGFNAEEGATFPDNTPEFVQAAEQALRFSTRTGLRIIAPTLHMTKAEIVQAGRAAGAPLEFVWSCYDAGPRPCQKCESCLRLRRALAESQ